MALLPDETHSTDAWITGVRGLVLREVTAARLVGAVRAVAGGLIVIDPILADVLRPPKDLPPSSLIEPLSAREIEVLQLIAEGLSNREIAQRLVIALSTVKVHTRNIYGKLGVKSRTQAVARARALGVLPTERDL